MDYYLEECLSNQVPGKYLFPFLWMHGEEQSVLREEIEAIYHCGIREFCVESRPYEQFEEEPWWTDMEYVLQEAQKRGMRVWILDDKHFPTGYANRWIEKHPELKKVSLRLEYMDVAGPEKECALLANRLDAEESYVSIVAWKRNVNGEFGKESVNLTAHCQDGLGYWDIPEGIWRVFFVIRTYHSISSKKNYIDLLSRESCMAMIHGVYEPHYAHLKKYFGNVLAGFFFDEPGFHNDELTYCSKLGKSGMLIPWNDVLPKVLAGKMKVDENRIYCCLPMLWQDIGEITPRFRMAYMDSVSLKVKENFSEMIGNWCRMHGILSVGHLIEDMNAHMRLGYGAGHYFRALEGQDMAGMDIVLGQVNPEIRSVRCAAPVIEDCVDPAFFLYTLPKMAASHSHFCQRKKGRAMCEIFGAYGWVEGLPMMKAILDEMLVSGINYFVPHAFSPKYPDQDCPPHFWARGNNKQYLLFEKLVSYMKRCCHLLSDGIHKAPVALLYNAEADWSGGSYMPMEKLTEKLTHNQIDFDIIPEDEIYRAVCREEKITIYKETYQVLLVPYTEFMPERLFGWLMELRKEGAKVYFVDGSPSFCLKENEGYIIKYEELISKLYSLGIEKIVIQETSDIELRVYQYIRKKTELYVFLNEDKKKEWSGKIRVSGKQGVFYYPWENKIKKAIVNEGSLDLHLFPGELKLFISDDRDLNMLKDTESCFKRKNRKLLDLRFDISIWKKDQFELYCQNSKLINLAKTDFLPRYSGKILYETTFQLSGSERYSWMDLGIVGETAELWVNDIYCGACISKPYLFDVKFVLKEGENRIRVEVIANMAYKERDEFSKYFPLPPSGILGPVELWEITNS